MIRGITKVRNEGHIIRDTLDSWAEVCDAIHVYDDASTDFTRETCLEHPSVVEVISSSLQDPDRERAEWTTRQTVLSSALRQGADWICYFDGDEQLEEFDISALDKDIVSLQLFDTYITEEDKDVDRTRYRQRRMVAPEFQPIPYFYRTTLPLEFKHPDQRILLFPEQLEFSGKVRHWGKGISVEHFEKKCLYYSKWPKYAEKWEARRGHAVHTESDFGNPLVPWEDILNGNVEPMWTMVEAQNV